MRLLAPLLDCSSARIARLPALPLDEAAATVTHVPGQKCHPCPRLHLVVQGAVTRTATPAFRLVGMNSGQVCLRTTARSSTTCRQAATSSRSVANRATRRISATRSVTSGIPHFIYFNLGLPLTFPIAVPAGGASSVLVDATAFSTFPLPAMLAPLDGQAVSDVRVVPGASGVFTVQASSR